MSDKRRGLAINNSFMALHGTAQVMIGTTLPEIIRSFDLSLSQGGLIVAAQGLGGLIVLLAGMFFADRVRKPVWILGLVGTGGVLIAVTGLAPAYWFVIVVFFVTGTVVQTLDSFLNAFTGEIAATSRTRDLNVLHMLYGVGAFVGPTFARWLLNQSLEWNAVYWIVGAVYLAAAVISLVWVRSYLALEPRPVKSPIGSVSAGDAKSPALADARRSRYRWGTVTVTGLILLFYAAHQLGTVSWLPLYLESVLGVSANLASVSLSLYWIGIIVSRFLTSLFGGRLGEMRILIWGSAAGGIVLIAAVLLGTAAPAIVGFFVAGVFTGATIPLAMSIAHETLPARTGGATSLVYCLMMAGRLIGPWTMGAVGDAFGLSNGIIVAGAVLFVAAALAAAVGLRRRETS